ncbi:MAG: sulfate adenylyltransferase [Candidatus Heimdallarchaeota archaeon]
MVEPHGNRLIEQLTPPEKAESAKEEAREFPALNISNETFIEIFSIAIGTYSPLEGFLVEAEFHSVLETNRLLDGLPWTIPIVLDVPNYVADTVELGQHLALTYDDRIVATIDVQSKFSPRKNNWVKSVFGTTDVSHPGVKSTGARHDILLGGKIDLFERPTAPFSQYHFTPKETRVLFKTRGWKQVVGFQTRNAPHIGHEYLQKTALTFVDGLFINPVIGKKKKGDFKDEVILDSYQTLLDHYYLKERAVLGTLLTEMHYAGPKEAIHHSIMRKNFGCSHFIIGRDHAGVGNYYAPYAAQEIFDDFPDLGIVPLFFRSFYRCKKCGSIVNEKICPHSAEFHTNFSGTKIRDMLVAKTIPPADQMRPEVSETILRYNQPFVQ